MRITRRQLKRIIREQMDAYPSDDMGASPSGATRTLGELISRLQLLQETHGSDIKVVVVLDDGGYLDADGPVDPKLIKVRDDHDPDSGESGSNSLSEGDYISVGYIEK